MSIIFPNQVRYTDFGHHDLTRSHKSRRVFITEVLDKNKSLIIEIKGAEHRKGKYCIEMPKTKFPKLTKDSVLDISNMVIVDNRDLEEFKFEITDKEFLDKVDEMKRLVNKEYLNDPWTFRSWCLRSGIKDITIKDSDSDSKSLKKIETAKAASDLDICGALYDIDKFDQISNCNFIILEFDSDKDDYVVFFSFERYNKKYAFVMYDQIFDIIGPKDSFIVLYLYVIKCLSKIKNHHNEVHLYEFESDDPSSGIIKALIDSGESRLEIIHTVLENKEETNINEITNMIDKYGETHVSLIEKIKNIKLV